MDGDTLDENGAVLTIRKPTMMELFRHELVMICSILHEIQHVATDLLLNPVDNVADEIDEVSLGPAKVAKVAKRNTPEHNSSTKYAGGQNVGDSGYALEGKIFGGRLMHWKKKNLPMYLVIFLSMIFLRNTM